MILDPPGAKSRITRAARLWQAAVRPQQATVTRRQTRHGGARVDRLVDTGVEFRRPAQMVMGRVLPYGPFRAQARALRSIREHPSWVAAWDRGDEIFITLPDDIREGRVRVSFSDSELGALLQQHRGFTSEAHLHRWVYVHRRLATVFARIDVETGRIGAEYLAAAEAGYDRDIGLDQALAQLRACQAEIKAIREASGCEAHYREAEDLERRASEEIRPQHKAGYARRRDCVARMGA
jgi:hypothetical protein